MKKILLSAMVIAAMTSCSKNADTCPDPDQGDMSPVNISAQIAADITPEQTGASKVSGTTWAANDIIAIYSDKGKLGLTVSDAAGSRNGATYKRGATAVWTNETKQWFWADNNTSHHFYAYHTPALTAVTMAADSSQVALPDLTGQTGITTLDALKTSKEFLYGNIATQKAASVVIPMKRALSIIQLNIKLADNAFLANTLVLTNFVLTSANAISNQNTLTPATINISNSTITATGGPTSYTAAFVTPLSNSTAQTASIAILPNNAKIQVEFNSLAGSSGKIDLSSSFVEGKIYTYTVIISAKLQAVTISEPTITDWNTQDGGTISPGI